MVVREKNCYYAIALTDFFVFLSCAEISNKYARPNSSLPPHTLILQMAFIMGRRRKIRRLVVSSLVKLAQQR